MTKKWLQERSSGTSSVGNCIQRVVGSDSNQFTNYLMNLPRNYGTYNKRRVIMPKSGEKTRLKSPKKAARLT